MVENNRHHDYQIEAAKKKNLENLSATMRAVAGWWSIGKSSPHKVNVFF
tara:strand:- start:112 stop:258 length:147 start_codon:yes stop_codon:yes gene_type:complete